MDIKFLGYYADQTLEQAYAERANPMDLEIFYNSINQNGGECSCCHQDVRKYAIFNVSLPIKPDVLSLCPDCINRLPAELEIINISSNGAPPALRCKK